MLEARHVEEPWRGADVRRHDGAPSATPVGEAEQSAAGRNQHSAHGQQSAFPKQTVTGSYDLEQWN